MRLTKLIKNGNDTKSPEAFAKSKIDSFHLLTLQQLHCIEVIESNTETFALCLGEISTDFFDGNRVAYLYRLPFSHRQNWLCMMSFCIRKSCTVHIDDWHSKWPNNGYGCLFLSHLISYFRYAGFRAVTGSIQPTDFNHEEKLRHIYGKFGFIITDQGDHRSLRLDLFKQSSLK